MSAVNAQTNMEFGASKTCISGSSIEDSFADSAIFITGGTGFLGKALLEKLLYSFTRLAIIFILIRPKKGKTIMQRCTELLESSAFDRIRTKDPEALNKIHPVEGDVSLPDLGLSPEDRNMLEERVNIVLHGAATLKFNEPLRVAVNFNTKSTGRIIDLCQNMKNLKSVVHVSTAYSNPNLKDVEESIYTTKVKPSTVIDMCDNLDEDVLNAIEKKLTKNHPNTYTFSKNLAEQLILTKARSLPITIVRPSIICSATRDPFPGWVDGFTAITNLVMSIGGGSLRALRTDANMRVDLVPVDYVVDTIICASWHNTIQQSDSIKIYNCTSNAEDLSWGTLCKLIEKYSIKSPSKHTIWYPGCFFISNKYICNISSGMLHLIPAFIADNILSLVGNKPMMMKRVSYMISTMHSTEHFTLNEWNFYRDNMDNLKIKIKSLNDGKKFKPDMKDLNWDIYIHDLVIGVKKYILKENSEDLSKARSRLSIFYYMHRLIQILSIVTLVTLIIRVVSRVTVGITAHAPIIADDCKSNN